MPLPSQHTVVLHSLKKVSFTYLHIQMYIDFFFSEFQLSALHLNGAFLAQPPTASPLSSGASFCAVGKVDCLERTMQIIS